MCRSTDTIHTELKLIVDDRAMPLASLAVAAVRDGQLAGTVCLGSRRIERSGGSDPVDERTLFRVASLSKLVTTLGVLRLREAGLLDLDADVSGFLGWRLRNPHFPNDAISLRMLLTHTSSLRDDAGYFWPGGVALRQVLCPDGSVDADVAMWSTAAAPGAFFRYANLPFGVVGTVMEAVTGERFDRLMQRWVIDPLGLAGGFSVAAMSQKQRSSLAVLYRKARSVDGQLRWDESGPWVPQVDDDSLAPVADQGGADYRPGGNGTLYGPQGSCRLSVQGLASIICMLLNDGRHAGGRFLKPESIDLMLAEHWRYDSQSPNGNTGGEFDELPRRAMNAWGLGVQRFLDITGAGIGDRLIEPGGYMAWGHLGDAYGLRSGMVFNREKRSGMVYLCGGTGADPAKSPGQYSAMARFEERVLTAIHQHMLAGA